MNLADDYHQRRSWWVILSSLSSLYCWLLWCRRWWLHGDMICNNFMILWVYVVCRSTGTDKWQTKQDTLKPCAHHYNDVIMSAMASQITSLTIVYSTVYRRCRSKKISKFRVTGLCRGNSLTGEFPAQRASNAENDSIWWRHHVLWDTLYVM